MTLSLIRGAPNSALRAESGSAASSPLHRPADNRQQVIHLAPEQQKPLPHDPLLPPTGGRADLLPTLELDHPAYWAEGA